jgi:hypothetical protein
MADTYSYEKRYQHDGSYKIYEIKNKRYVDEDYEEYLTYIENGGETQTIDYVEPEPIPEPTLEILIENKKQEINNAKWQQIYGGTTLDLGGNPFTIDTSDSSQTLINGAALSVQLDPSYSCEWKVGDNYIVLNAQTIIAVAIGVRAFVQNCFDKEKNLLNIIKTITTKEELDAIVYN